MVNEREWCSLIGYETTHIWMTSPCTCHSCHKDHADELEFMFNSALFQVLFLSMWTQCALSPSHWNGCYRGPGHLLRAGWLWRAVRQGIDWLEWPGHLWAGAACGGHAALEAGDSSRLKNAEMKTLFAWLISPVWHGHNIGFDVMKWNARQS